jgi:hypothetical protein
MAPSNPETGDARARVPPWLATVGCVALIAALQLGMTWGRLDVPFYDGIIHYNFDNANFTYLSRNGIRVATPQSQLGLTQVQHSAWGVPSGSPSFYTHHPFLFKAAFQLVVRVFGDAERVSRTFALAVSFLAATGVLAALWVASRNVVAAMIGAAVLVSIPVFAMYQACLKYELDGMAIGAWYFVAVGLFLARRGRGVRLAIAVLAGLSAVAHWTALIFVCCTTAWLLAERFRGRDREVLAEAAIASGVGAGVGAVLILAVFAWLRGGVAAIFTHLTEAAASRSGGARLLERAWFDRQAAYVSLNFGALLPWVTCIALILVIVDSLRRRTAGASGGASERLLPAFFFCSAATALLWQFGFAQGSFVHIYWQLWFCVPIAGLLAWSIVAAGRHGRGAAAVAGVLVVALVVQLYSSSRVSYDALVRNQFGNDGDVAFLKELRRDRFSRFVFMSTENTRANEWFQGPTFEYYTDRAITFFEEGATRLGPEDKVLLPNRPDPWLTMALGAQLGGLFTNRKCGPRFCAYDFRPNGAEGGRTPP